MKIKKLVSILAALCMLCTVFSGMTLTASAETPALTSAYDSAMYQWIEGLDTWDFYRHENWLVRYDYGFDANVDFPANASNHSTSWYSLNCYTEANRTATNQYGIEIAVNKYGYVTAIEDGVGNMAIPEGGYVLSANGTKATTLRSRVTNGYLKVGDLVHTSDGVSYFACRVTDDDKLLGDSVTLNIAYTNLAGSYADSVVIGDGVATTNRSYWQNYLLVKQTGTTDAGLPTGYAVKMINASTVVPEGYFAVTLPGQTVNDNGSAPYNAAQLMKEYASAGTLVTCGSNELYFRYDAAAAVRAAQLMTGATGDTVNAMEDFSAGTIYNDALDNYELVDTDRMGELYGNMTAITETVTADMTVDELKPYLATIYQNYDELALLEYEVRTVEMRATWMRPLPNDGVERSAEELDALLTESILGIKEQGYNMIFVETLYNSTTIFPVPDTVGYNGISFNQNPYLVPTSEGGLNSKLTESYDMLQRFIDICEENEMEPHIWWEIFYVGYVRTNGMTDSLFDYSVAKIIEEDTTGTYANWLNTASNGELYYGAATDGALQYFLNPASDGARTFLMNTFEYVWANYDVESFQLDYIRYPHTSAAKSFGYDEDTLWRFTQSTYYDASVHTTDYLKTYEGFYDADWVQFRADFVTSFVKEIKDNMGEIAPDMYLTASPGAEPEESKANLMQDVSYWLENDYIDIIFPMAYGENVPGYVSNGLVRDNIDHFVCTGVSGSYLDNDMEARWMKEIRDAGADGLAAFVEIPDYADYVWSKAAITPTGNASKAARVYLADTVNARADQMLKLGGIGESELTQIKAATAALDEAIRLYGLESTEALEAINALQAVADGLPLVRTALTKDVNYILKIRNNSHDTAKEARELGESEATLAVNGVKITDGGEEFSYVSSTDTLYIKVNEAVISGELSDTVTLVLAEGVTAIELDAATMFSTLAVESDAEVTVYLSGTSTVTTDTFAQVNYTLIGTGELYNGDTLVMRKGDVVVDSSEAVNSTDIRELLQYNVKAASFTDEQIAIGDANGDGKINTIDTRIFLDTLV